LEELTESIYKNKNCIKCGYFILPYKQKNKPVCTFLLIKEDFTSMKAQFLKTIIKILDLWLNYVCANIFNIEKISNFFK